MQTQTAQTEARIAAKDEPCDTCGANAGEQCRNPLPWAKGKSNVYDTVIDAEGNGVAFIYMRDNSAKIRDRIIEAVNREDGPMEPTQDERCAFARLMSQTEWQYADEPAEVVISYFESPWKWNREFQKWKELGGTMEPKVINAFSKWLNWRCETCGEMPCVSDCDTREDEQEDSVYIQNVEYRQAARVRE